MQFMSGRALFQYNPDLFEDAEDAADDTIFDEEREGEDDDNMAEETKNGGAAQ